MTTNANYEKRFHFFTNDGKKELTVSCFHGLLNAQSGIREDQYIRVFLGFIELGVIEGIEELEVVRIGGRGLSRFTSEKTGNRYQLIEPRCFNKMVSEDISLEEFLRLTLPDITFHVGSEEESDNWLYYNKAIVSKYIRYSHPLCSNEEMQRMREDEKRIIFWDMMDKSREKLWFTVGSCDDARWKSRLSIESAEDLREACHSYQNVIAFLGNIQIGVVWHQKVDDFFMFGGSQSGLGKIFTNGDDCFALWSEQLNAFLVRNISLEEFVHTAYTEFNGDEPEYAITIADDAQKVWQSIQDGWTFTGRVKDIMFETGYTNSSPERFSEESRVLFVKRINR